MVGFFIAIVVLMHRDRQGERGTGARLAPHSDAAVVVGGNVFDDRQAQSAAASGTRTRHVEFVPGVGLVVHDGFAADPGTIRMIIDYPFDEGGRRRAYRDVPKRISALVDDPFRSLAGELRRSGGFAKDTTPFSEFLWADFLRRKMSRKAVEANFEKSIEKALALGRSKDAVYLPGWCGPASDD